MQNNWTEEKLKALSKTVVGEEAAHFIREIILTPYYESYVALRTLMGRLNEDLQSGEITIFNQKSIDVNGTTIIDNTFPNAHKYATEMQSYHEQLEYLKGKILPEDLAKAEVESTSLIDEARRGLKKRRLNEV